MSYQLETTNFDVGYGNTQVLHGLSITLSHNEHVGLFGPNGHGKTTLLKTISGLLRPWRGTILERGERIDGLSPRQIVARGITHVAQGSPLFPEMTVLENLWLAGQPKRVRADWTKYTEKVFYLFPLLAERRKQLCRTLSGGERQMLAIGMGLMADPKILMLDEPTLGLAPRVKESLCEAIVRIGSEGLPLLTVDQDVEFLMSFSNRLYFINHGTVTAVFDKNSQLDQSDIISMYFGRS
jgi:branched-chain amino acid transport system ATP-binding protein